MSSASTFANKVVAVLQEIEEEKKISFELFFTGHSLGGWLAQITTFTTEYLQEKGGTFLKKWKRKQVDSPASSTVLENHDVRQSYHPHTVVFESPGCEKMLSQMKQTFDVRCEGRSIHLKHLDITSYLSAPNLINTCNSHLGTVYRIFTDLSDMSSLEIHTPLYNLATHRIDKIVEVFDPTTGQVTKDEQGQLKVQVVVNWPISAGIKDVKEYRAFFKWTQHLNNYHPDITDISFQLLHCSPIRYQTKLYDERVNSVRIFSEEEQEFLQCCRWLRQWSEFFQTKEMFSVMENTQAQEKAEEMLRNFQILNHTIRCIDASVL